MTFNFVYPLSQRFACEDEYISPAPPIVDEGGYSAYSAYSSYGNSGDSGNSGNTLD
jgi:hypothetical protein